jgi:translin
VSAEQAELAGLVNVIRQELGALYRAREAGLADCRRAIRAAGSAIRAVHRHQPEQAAQLLGECEAALREAQAAVAGYPTLAHGGFLHDAEKEYVEAVLTRAFVGGTAIADWRELKVGIPAWLHGLCEAASELRRHSLDLLRQGQVAHAERLLRAMEDTYDLLVGIDFPDAITAGLRRAADSLRAVLERTRSDLTTTVLQLRLQGALQGRLLQEGSPDGAVE